MRNTAHSNDNADDTRDPYRERCAITRPVLRTASTSYINICAEYFNQNPVEIGGPGIHVEIDESKFGRRKYKPIIFADFTGLRTLPSMVHRSP